MADDALARAREACAHHRWEEAYRAFLDVREVRDLDAADLAALADAAWWTGRTDASLSASEEAFRLHLDGGEARQAARLALEMGFLWLLRGDPTVGSGWLRRSARLLDDVGECAERGYLASVEAEEALERGAVDEAAAAAERIQGIADRCDDATLTAVGLVLEGRALVRRGRVDDGLATIDEAMLPVRAGSVAPAWAGNLYCQVMTLCFELADYRRARAWTAATERWCDQHDSAAMFAGICRVHRAQLLCLEGAWRRAEDRAAQACRDLADMNVAVVAEGHYVIAEARRRRGDLPAAEAAYDLAAEHGRDPQPGLALLRLAQGRPAAARAALDAALASAEGPLTRAGLLAARVEVAQAIAGAPGDATPPRSRQGAEEAAAARTAAAELTEIAEAFASPGLLASARHAAGAARLVAGEPARAVPLLRDAATRWRGLEAPHEAAHARLTLSLALAAAGDAEAADREATGAAAALTALGAERPADAGPALPGGLTAREAEVLALVASGRSNREVAGELSISERTVERHLANVFVKVDVGSRTEAAAFAFAHGLADPAHS